MPWGLGPGDAAALIGALIGAAYVRGYAGFGFSAIFIAFAALITNPLPLIPAVFLCEILMTLPQARGLRGHVDWRRVAALLAGAVLVLPFSVAFILSIGAEAARLTVSGIVLVMSLVLLSGWSLQRVIRWPGFAGVGGVSGLCNAAGVGGLPVAAFLAAQPIPAARFRATMIVYLTGLDLLTLPLMWRGGLVTAQTFIAAGLAFPLLALGVWLGGRRFTATSPEDFRRFAIWLLCLLATLGLIRGVI